MAKKATKKRAAPRPRKSGGAKSGAVSDWRTGTLAELRQLILEADPEIVEEKKWVKPTNPAGVPVWSHGGNVCTGETYKEVVKLTFFRGAALDDPKGLFNAGFNGGTRRAIDLHEGEKLNAKAFKTLIKAAVAENLKSAGPKAKAASKPAKRKPAKAAGKVKLLSGGNPQIAKGDGNAPVQAYIAAMPGWKRELGERLDALIERTVPNVQKAVKWNSPLYGVEGQGWFLGVHCFAKYVKLAFFRGTDLRPQPPGPSRDKNTRYLDILEDGVLDEAQLTSWLQQAAAIPGWSP